MKDPRIKPIPEPEKKEEIIPEKDEKSIKLKPKFLK